ncbi:MAG TPA: hypothetical protein VK960_04535 [Acidimicrobiia bacterium]|nr:hypothetical protein [Acidimicrobiia bacterium]
MDVALVVIGATLATYGWYWGGVTEARTTAYALGAFAFMLGLWFAFSGGAGGDAVLGGTVSFAAVFGFLASANAWNESAQDRTFGMFALLFAIVSLFGFMYFSDAEAAGQYTFSALILGVVFALIFISAALVHHNRGFKNLVGWVTLIAGIVLVYFGFAEALGNGLEPF